MKFLRTIVALFLLLQSCQIAARFNRLTELQPDIPEPSIELIEKQVIQSLYDTKSYKIAAGELIRFAMVKDLALVQHMKASMFKDLKVEKLESLVKDGLFDEMAGAAWDDATAKVTIDADDIFCLESKAKWLEENGINFPLGNFPVYKMVKQHIDKCLMMLKDESLAKNREMQLQFATMYSGIFKVVNNFIVNYAFQLTKKREQNKFKEDNVSLERRINKWISRALGITHVIQVLNEVLLYSSLPDRKIPREVLITEIRACSVVTNHALKTLNHAMDLYIEYQVDVINKRRKKEAEDVVVDVM